MLSNALIAAGMGMLLLATLIFVWDTTPNEQPIALALALLIWGLALITTALMHKVSR